MNARVALIIDSIGIITQIQYGALGLGTTAINSPLPHSAVTCASVVQEGEGISAL
jgi:hypothetical protein